MQFPVNDEKIHFLYLYHYAINIVSMVGIDSPLNHIYTACPVDIPAITITSLKEYPFRHQHTLIHAICLDSKGQDCYNINTINNEDEGYMTQKGGRIAFLSRAPFQVNTGP